MVISPGTNQKNVSGFQTKDLALTGIFAALITICSWISIPMAVPFTMQTFGVFMAVEVLGGRRGTIAVLTYLLLGAAGLPVFSGFTGGLGILLGSTGGYIVGFLAAALVMWLIESMFPDTNAVRLLAMLSGLVTCYTLGTVWFMIVYSGANGAVGIMTVLGWCVIPFILPDLIKIALAYLLSRRVRRYV